MPKTFVSGEQLTAADLNAHCVNFPPKIWTGKLAANTAVLTASNYTSIKPSTVVAATGDLAVTFDTDSFSVGENGWYQVTFQASFESASTGNRLVGLNKNFTTKTLNSGTAPGSAFRLRWYKTEPNADTTSAAVVWTGPLVTTDYLMAMVRTTTAVAIGSGIEETALTITQLRVGV